MGDTSIKSDIELSIVLQEDEVYFKDQRVSQVIQSNVNQLLVALWDKPGYYRIQRKSYENHVTYIPDETGVKHNYHCTDLVGISADNLSFIQYFIARTETAINIIDTVKEKVYCLSEEPSSNHK